MPLTSQTECIIRDGNIYTGPTNNLEKFWIYVWEGHSLQEGGNWKIAVPLSVVSRTPLELPLDLIPLLGKHKKLPPRITLGKPVPPEPPVIMGGGVPVMGLSASSKIDPKTQKRDDEYKLLRNQPLPAQERHEYKAYPQDVLPGQNTRRKRNTDSTAEDAVIYHSYISLCWQYLGLQQRMFDCLNNLESVCIAHYLPAEMLRQSLYRSTRSGQKKRQTVRFSSALRQRMETFMSQGQISFLLGNLRAVAIQIEVDTGETLSENEIHELERFQAFEELASLDRGLPVLYLYPFQNVYEMERAEGQLEDAAIQKNPNIHNNTHSKERSYNPPLRELRCLLEPAPLQQKLELHASPCLYL